MWKLRLQYVFWHIVLTLCFAALFILGLPYLICKKVMDLGDYAADRGAEASRTIDEIKQEIYSKYGI